MTRPHHGVHPHRRHQSPVGTPARAPSPPQAAGPSPAKFDVTCFRKRHAAPQPAAHRKQEHQLPERHLELVSVRGRSDWLCGTGLRVRSLNGHGEAMADRRSVVEADRVAAASPSARRRPGIHRRRNAPSHPGAAPTCRRKRGPGGRRPRNSPSPRAQHRPRRHARHAASSTDVAGCRGTDRSTASSCRHSR
jgi:hypothetical protein